MIKNILMIFLISNITLNADFTKTGNIVTDSVTQLQWQDNIDSINRYWGESITYCETLSLDSFSDWRLPSINELKSLFDRNKTTPFVVSDFEHILSTTGDQYFSSTTSTVYGNSDYAYTINFYFGQTGRVKKLEVSPKVPSVKTICVRAGK